MPSGAFRSTLNDSGEADVRFLYCACAISAALDDWSSVDTEAAVRYIQQCVTYEGGIAVVPGMSISDEHLQRPYVMIHTPPCFMFFVS